MLEPNSFDRIDEKIEGLSRHDHYTDGQIEQIQYLLRQARQEQRQLAEDVGNLKFSFAILMIAVFGIPLVKWLWSWL